MNPIVERTLPDLDLAQIAQSGQCFSWEDLGDGWYGIPVAGHYIEVWQRGDRFRFSCGEAEFSSFWQDYFDLGTDYSAIKKSVDPEDHYLTRAVGHGAGIRILRQDFWEVMVSFLLSQNNNITRITRSLRLLRESWGTLQNAPGTLAGSYHTFPSPDALRGVAVRAFEAIGFGYRARYLAALVAEMRGDGLSRLIHELRASGLDEAMGRLCSLYGVGKKVASCICLFGLHHIDAFPIDTHIQKILDAHYPKGFPFTHYRGHLGIIQQYLFYEDLHYGA